LDADGIGTSKREFLCFHIPDKLACEIGMENEMMFASATTIEPGLHEAVDSLVEQVRGQFVAQGIDFLIVFMTGHFASRAAAVGEGLQEALKPRVLLGATCEGVIGREAEIEDEPAVTLLAAHVPGIELCPFTLNQIDWDEVLGDPAQFHALVGAPNDTRLFMMIADPFSTPMEDVLNAFNTCYTGLPVIGGMASAAQRPGGNALLLNDRVFTTGGVGVALAGDFEADIVVSQGCRPIGRAYTVTNADRNVIYSLEGEPPLSRIRGLIADLSEEDQSLLQAGGLYFGRAIDPGSGHGASSGKEKLGRGDFLIRGMMGIDPESGAVAVGDHVEAGVTVQFHLRDQHTAEEDLEMLLTPQALFDPPQSAILFSCNGRGTRLYDHPNGDVSTIQKVLGGVDLAGFFCAGEIGPIGGKNFLHGHTASMVLFRA
jgi:small ligand-binding sensory domain FIST